MKKYLIGLFILTSFIWANELTVKRGAVKASINGKEFSFKNTDSLVLEKGSYVCYISGKGRIVINKKIQLFSKTQNKCFQIPIPKNLEASYFINKAKEIATVVFIDSSENVRDGVSTKGAKAINDNKEIIVSVTSKNLIIYSKEFGPHPVRVNIKDTKGEIMSSFVNEENDITYFKIDSNILKTNYRLEVLSGFDEVLINKKIVKE